MLNMLQFMSHSYVIFGRVCRICTTPLYYTKMSKININPPEILNTLRYIDNKSGEIYKNGSAVYFRYAIDD